MTLKEKDELVDRVLARLALFVHDLPASESSHHSERFGLLEHLLEVAHGTVRELSAPSFRVSPEPSTNHCERPLWIYAGLVAALAHDIGKPLDLEVSAPGKGVRWDPGSEPLRSFCERHGLSGTGPELWHFHAARGRRGHEKAIPTLLPLILTPAVSEYLGPRLDSVIGAMTADEEWKDPKGHLWPAREVVRVVRRIDAASAKDGRKTGEESAARPPAAPERQGVRPLEVQEISPVLPNESTAPAGVGASTLRPLSDPAGPAAPAGEGDSDCFTLTPPDYWAENVPSPKGRRGDPVEMEQRLRFHLEPAKFLETLRQLVINRRLSRNNLYTELYIRPDFVWLILPRALRRVALINRLPWDTDVETRMIASLGASPQIAAASVRTIPVFVRTRPEAASCKAVRIRTPGFLPERQLEVLGIYPYELRALDPRSFFAPERPSAS
jgi:hypothetical protein